MESKDSRDDERRAQIQEMSRWRRELKPIIDYNYRYSPSLDEDLILNV